MKSDATATEMSFWDHLEELRGVLWRALIVVLVPMVVLFCFKDFIFDRVILAPLGKDFALYSFLNGVLALFGLGPVDVGDISLINVDLAAQFFTHVKVSFNLALVIAAPVIFYLLWTFVRPALYPKEREAARGGFGFAGLLFYAGVLTGYFVVFPLTLHFLGSYQVSASVPNLISLNSYIGMMVSLIMVMGLVFEMHVLAAILSRLGLISKQLLRKYRRHAIVVLMILSAVITPSGDAFTMLMVSIPLYLLYELSILVCVNKNL